MRTSFCTGNLGSDVDDNTATDNSAVLKIANHDLEDANHELEDAERGQVHDCDVAGGGMRVTFKARTCINNPSTMT